jgi:hypothetical protein
LALTVNSVFGIDDLLQGVVSLGTDFHGLREGGSSNGKQHELLEGELVSGMGTTVDDVECGSGKDVGRLDASELGQMLVQGDTLLNSSSLGDGNTDAENGVGSELTLVRGTVELDEEVIDVLLGGDLKARLDQLRGNNVVDIGDGLRNTCAGVNGPYLKIYVRGYSPFPT